MSNVYVNIDINTVLNPFVNALASQKYIFEEMFYPIVDVYRNTHVTDVLIDCFCQISVTDSKVFETVTQLADYSEKTGRSIRIIDRFKGHVRAVKEFGIDPYDIWFKRVWSNGQRPWLSIRMNDAHPFQFLDEEELNAFHLKAVKNGWVLGKEYDWFRNCYDFRYEEVRQKMLDYISEQINRYDVYGLELDFLRENQCFKYLTDNMDECTEIMNEFIRDVKKIVTEAEKIHGHSIKICVRVMRDMIHTKYYGFDPVVWDREGLVDIVNPSPRFTGGDSGIPIAEWKKLLPNTEVVAGVESLLAYSSELDEQLISTAAVRALSAAYLDMGSDGMYFYNYYLNPDNEITKAGEPAGEPYARGLAVLSSCGDKDKLYNYPLRFTVIPQAGEGFAACPEMWQPIPARLDSEDKVFDIYTGKIPEGKLVSVIVGIENGFEDAKIDINGIDCTEWKDIDLSYIPGIGVQPKNYVSDRVKCCRCVLDNKILREKVQTVTIRSKANCNNAMIRWVEIVMI